MSMLIHILLEHHLFDKYLLSSKLGARDFPRLWEYICKHIGETDITYIIRNFRRGGSWSSMYSERRVFNPGSLNYSREPRKDQAET